MNAMTFHQRQCVGVAAVGGQAELRFDAMPHLGGGRFGEGDHQHFIQRHGILRVQQPARPRRFKTPLWWLVGAITIIGCIVFFFSLRASTQRWFVIWNAVGLVVYFGWSAWNSRLAKGEETAG